MRNKNNFEKYPWSYKNLKNTLLCILAILFANLFCYSQVKYGVTLGVNSSRFSDEFNTTGGEYLNTSSLGVSLGLFAELPLQNKISFCPEIIYNQIGDRDKNYSDYFGLNRIDYKLDYISIPLNLKFFHKPYLLVGPQLGILVSQTPESIDFGKVDNSFDIGGNIGIGYPIENFKIELIFYQSVTDVFEIETNRDGNRKFNLRNTYLNLNVSYTLFN